MTSAWVSVPETLKDPQKQRHISHGGHTSPSQSLFLCHLSIRGSRQRSHWLHLTVRMEPCNKVLQRSGLWTLLGGNVKPLKPGVTLSVFQTHCGPRIPKWQKSHCFYWLPLAYPLSLLAREEPPLLGVLELLTSMREGKVFISPLRKGSLSNEKKRKQPGIPERIWASFTPWIFV